MGILPLGRREVNMGADGAACSERRGRRKETHLLAGFIPYPEVSEDNQPGEKIDKNKEREV